MSNVPESAALIEQEFEMVSVDDLILHPQNPNEGDVGAICESMAVNGFWGVVIVQRSTGYVLVGNHRLTAARSLNIKHVPVSWVDVDDELAMRILLSDNQHARLSTNNVDSLAELLTQLAMTDIGLSGTGFDGDDLDAMMREFEETPKEKPEKKFKVVVACADPDEQHEILTKLLAMGLDAKPR